MPVRLWLAENISIHAARVGCDTAERQENERTGDFNPRSPSGLRLSCPPWLLGGSWYFNPRSPSGLRRCRITVLQVQQHFNPRSPSGLRLIYLLIAIIRSDFNPRSPSGLRRGTQEQSCTHADDFNPRSPSGLRLLGLTQAAGAAVFQSTQPEWAATAILRAKNLPKAFQSTQPEWAATQ